MQSSLDLFMSSKFAANTTGVLVQGRDELLEENFKSKTSTKKKPTTKSPETQLNLTSSASTTTSNKEMLKNGVGVVDHQKDEDESDEKEVDQLKSEFNDVYQNAEFPNFPDLENDDREDDQPDFDSDR